MPYNPQIHHRQSIRLKGYDYSQDGAYFLTICADNHACMFGDVMDGEMQLNDGGEFVKKCWDEIPEYYPFVRLDEYVVMPNHVHGVLFIDNAMAVGAKDFSPVYGANDEWANNDRANNHSPLPTNRQINGRANKQINQCSDYDMAINQWLNDDRAYKPTNESIGGSVNNANADVDGLFNPLDKSRPNGTSKTIGAIVRGFKIGVTKWYRYGRGEKSFAPTIIVWQGNYYEHIIRNEEELNRIRYYIINNPEQWELDKNNPKNL